MKLWRDRTRGDVLVVGWKRVPGQAERANPEAGSNIHLAIRKSVNIGIFKGSLNAYQKGFNTDLHGCLQITGSNCKIGVSGFSFRGVYKAPMGTTRREASYAVSVSIF